MAADIQQLERALINADAAGDEAGARVLSGEIQRLRMTPQQAQMTHQPGPKPVDIPGAILAGLNSRVGKISDGIVQMTHAGDEPVQRGLKALDAERSKADARVQREHPIAFGIGDAAPLMAVPGGQGTAFGRVAAPAVGAAAMELLSFGDPLERAKRAAVAGGLGAVGGVAGEGLTAALLPRRSLAGLQPDVADAVRRNGFPLTAAQRTGSPTLTKLEDYLSTAPGAINRMQGVREQQQNVLNRLAARAIGQDTNVLDQSTLAMARQAIGADRKALNASVQVSPVNPDLITGVREARNAVNQLGAGPQSLTGTQAAAGSKVVDDIENFIRSGSPMDGAMYSTWRTAIREAKESAYDANNSKLGEAYASLQRGLDKAAQGTRTDAWRLNDTRRSALEMMEKGQVTNEATGNISPKRLANEFMRKYGASAKEGKLPGEIADIALLARGVDEYRPGSPTAGREAWSKLLYGGGGLAAGAGVAGANPALGALVLGVPALNNLLARAVTRQGAGLTGLIDSPVITEALREQLQRMALTGSQGAARGTVAPGLAVPH